MSYSLDIWSVHPVALPDALPQPDAWNRSGDAWARAGGAWQIVVEPSVKVEAEDIPEAVLPALPGIAFLTRLNLEPIAAPASAHTLIQRAARAMARHAFGVVYDPQASLLTAPSGVKRVAGLSNEATLSVISLNWWFLDGPLLADDGVERLVGLLASLLPEALPRRYGLFEPPAFRYQEQGRDAFAHFLQQHLDAFVVWYPSRPVSSVAIEARPGNGVEPRGFRACTFSIQVEAAACGLPGWEPALRRAWKALSLFIEPFYGDVRTLHGLVRSGGTVGYTGQSELHPVTGAWWNGVPRRLGHAVVLGPPYQDAWPAFRQHAEVSGNLWFASTPLWDDPADLSRFCGTAPRRLQQPTAPWIPFAPPHRRYPRGWPLSGPHPPR